MVGLHRLVLSGWREDEFLSRPSLLSIRDRVDADDPHPESTAVAKLRPPSPKEGSPAAGLRCRVRWRRLGQMMAGRSNSKSGRTRRYGAESPGYACCTTGFEPAFEAHPVAAIPGSSPDARSS